MKPTQNKSAETMAYELKALLYKIENALEGITASIGCHTSRPSSEALNAYTDAIIEASRYICDHPDFPEVEGMEKYFRSDLKRRNELRALHRAYGYNLTFLEWFNKNYKGHVEFLND